MCPSVPTHIDLYMNKPRLLLKTDDGTNVLCLGLVHTRDHDPGCFVAGIRNQPQGLQEVGLILCPFRNVTGGSELVLPLDTWRP